MELEELRNKKELVDYFKKFNIDITQEQIDYLKEKYSQKNSNAGNILSIDQLDNVAGGMIRIEKCNVLLRLFTRKEFDVYYDPNFRPVNLNTLNREILPYGKVVTTSTNQSDKQEKTTDRFNENIPGVYYERKFYLLTSLPEEVRTALTSFANHKWDILDVHEKNKGDTERLLAEVNKYQTALQSQVIKDKPAATDEDKSQPHDQPEVKPGINAVVLPSPTDDLYCLDSSTSTEHEDRSQLIPHHKVSEPISPIAKEMDADVVMLAALKKGLNNERDELFKFLAFEPKNETLRQYSDIYWDKDKGRYGVTKGWSMYTLTAKYEKDGLKMLFNKDKMLTSCLNRLHIPDMNVIDPSELSRMNLSFLISYLDERGEPTGVLKQYVDSLEVPQDLKGKIINKLSTIRFSINPQLNANDEVDQHILNFVSGITRNEQTRKIIEYNYKEILIAIKARLLLEAGVSDEKDKNKFNVVYNNGKMKIVYKHALTEVKSGKFDELNDETIEVIVKFMKEKLAENKTFLEKLFGNLFSSMGKGVKKVIAKKVMGAAVIFVLSLMLIKLSPKLKDIFDD